MAAVVQSHPHPRLTRLLVALGVPVETDPSQSGPLRGPRGPINLVSRFAFHRVREVLRALELRARELEPTSAEGQAWKAILQTMEDAPLLEGSGEPDAELAVLEGLEGALDVHQAVEVRLVQHRMALMQADLPEAQRTWAVFGRVMRHHIVVEDTLVTPRYVGAQPEDGWTRGAAPMIVANEHGKIHAKLEEFGRVLAQIESLGLPYPERAARCLELLDRQKVFADLLEHHDLRERAFVYPRLEQVLGAEQKAEIIAGLLAW